ncbi:metallophosphoesterase [Actinocorallia sp. API 0066]|uniref:metallophosphoesterase family protein n=1 Tax=Actinocorallia sp. API 0066 TaxID=2896846 RepID=UPI001E3C67D5|nr:metallophosphoesterase [Actinocorallia sp. API 0066]MCD0453036.1 metallophosphoesterase [Actinocorallia sp. API 0066]
MTRPDLTFFQLTDTHIGPAGEGADTLRTALAMIEGSGVPTAALLLTGDLTADGDTTSYRLLRQLVEPVARRIGAEPVYVMGNHDRRLAFYPELLDEPPSDRPYDTVREFDGVRVAVLDTTEPGEHDGHLADDQLARLRAVLAEPAPRGTVLVFHHPPVPSPVPSVNLLRLRAPERLRDAIEGTDVRLVVTGHAHHAGCGALADVPVWIGPALAYAVAPVPPRGRLKADAHTAFSRIDVFGDQIVVTAVPLSPVADTVYDVAEADRMRFLEGLLR